MSLIERCVVCDDKLPNQYAGGPCCGGVQCEREQLAELRAAFPDWNFSWEYGCWTAVHDGFEADWQGEEDGWVGNGLNTSGRTLNDLHDELECLIDEHPAFQEKASG